MMPLPHIFTLVFTLPRYFKRLDIPEMDKLGLPLVDAALSWSHAHNTLVVSYAKPAQVMHAVREWLG